MRTEDGHIIHKCLNGDPAAFGFLVDKYKASVYAFVYSRIGNFHDAEDLSQEVFINAYKNLRKLRQYDSFLAWLYSIASNLCKNWIRAQSRRPDSEFMEDKAPDVLTGPAIDSYRQKRALDTLREALESLPGMYRQVLTLHYLGGMSTREIARFVGASPAAIRKRLSKARSLLKEEMITMMRASFEKQKLQATFTFRIVEAAKRIKIHPMPRAAGLPWGLSLAAGIVITVLSLNPQFSIINTMNALAGSPILSEAKVLKTGEVPVDILKMSQIPFIASSSRGEDSEFPMLSDSQNAVLIAAHGDGDTWIRKSDMPTARMWFSTSVVDRKIYAIGGLVDVSTHTPVVEEYDPETDTWTKKANMSAKRDLLSTSMVDGKIYAIGGQSGVGNLVSFLEEYDPITDTWTKKSDMPTARIALSTCVVNGKIYAIGGRIHKGPFLPTVEEYDPMTDTWIKKADMPTARAFLSTAVVNGRIYAIGGAHHSNATNDNDGLSTVEEYDPATDTWATKCHMSTARWTLSTSVVNDRIYVIGGGDRQIPFKSVEEYDPGTDTWTKRSDMPTPKGGLSTSVVNGKIYVIGGTDGSNILSTVEEYKPGPASAGKN